MTRPAASTRQFHLIDADARAIDGRPVSVAVPDGISRFEEGSEGQPPRCTLDWPPSGAEPAACLLEPVACGSSFCLLLLAPDDRPIRVNGHRCVRVAGLREGDELQLHGGWTFHVALHVHCVIGVPPPAQARTPCGVCHRPAGDGIVYLCPDCDCPVHCDRRNLDEALDCLKICSECPGCRAPIVRDGYRWLPET